VANRKATAKTWHRGADAEDDLLHLGVKKGRKLRANRLSSPHKKGAC